MPRVTFDVVDHLFVVVCGCGPHDNAIFCYMYCVDVWHVLWLSRVTFDVVDHLFVVVFGCGPHDNVSRKLSYLLLHALWDV